LRRSMPLAVSSACARASWSKASCTCRASGVAWTGGAATARGRLILFCVGLPPARRRRTEFRAAFSARGRWPGRLLVGRAVSVRSLSRVLFGIGFMIVFKEPYECPLRSVTWALQRRWLKPAARAASSGTPPGCIPSRDLFPVVVPPVAPNDHRLPSGNPSGWAASEFARA